MSLVDKDTLLAGVNNIPEFVYRELVICKESGPQGKVSNDVGWKRILFDKHRAITEISNLKVISFVTGRYVLVQFRDIFKPLIEKNPNCIGKLEYHDGFAVLDIFPDGDTNANTKIGITAYNSVNKTSAMIIRFSVIQDGRILTLPKNIATYYKAHVGGVKQKTADYIELMSKVKEAWLQLLLDFSKINITMENFDTYTKKLQVNPRILKAVKLKIDSGSEYNLWSLTIYIYDEMMKGYSKSEIHRRKRIDEFVTHILSWSSVFTILGGNR